MYAFGEAKGRSREDLIRIYSQEELDDKDVEQVLEVLEEVEAREQSQVLTDASAEDALEALKPVSLPDWARKEAEDLVDFLSRRQY